jgi:quercetin dioxygenase-like cupin family protein
MSYGGERGEISGVLTRADAQKALHYKSGTLGTFVATGAMTRGDFGLYRWEMQANGGGAGGHFHRTFSESFYVLEGNPSFFDGAEWKRGGPGDFLYIPEGGIHGFRNDSPTPATMLILFSPGIAREAYFEALYDIGHSGRDMTQADWTALYAAHDQTMVEE